LWDGLRTGRPRSVWIGLRPGSAAFRVVWLADGPSAFRTDLSRCFWVNPKG